MLKNRKIQLAGLGVLIIAAFLVTLSAFNPPAPANEKAIIPVTGNEAGLAQYHRSEWGAPVANQNGLDLYHRSERVLAYPAKDVATSKVSNEAGLAQYDRSEHSAYVANQKGLDIYHMSERMQAENWTMSKDPLYLYHQSEWFGK